MIESTHTLDALDDVNTNLTTLIFNTNAATIAYADSLNTAMTDYVTMLSDQAIGYVDSSLAAQELMGDLTGLLNDVQLNPTNPGVGDRIVAGVNAASTTIADAAVADDLTIDGGTINNTEIGATGAAAGTFTTVTAETLSATSADFGGISTRFADTYTIGGAVPVSSVTIDNTQVTATSTIILTYGENGGSGVPAYSITGQTDGSFTVTFTGVDADPGDAIHYLIVNH